MYEGMSLAGIESNLQYLLLLKKQAENNLRILDDAILSLERAKWSHPEWEYKSTNVSQGECPPDSDGDPNCKHEMRDDEHFARVFCTKCTRSHQVYLGVSKSLIGIDMSAFTNASDKPTIDPAFPFNEAEVFPEELNRPVSDEEWFGADDINLVMKDVAVCHLVMSGSKVDFFNGRKA